MCALTSTAKIDNTEANENEDEQFAGTLTDEDTTLLSQTAGYISWIEKRAIEYESLVNAHPISTMAVQACFISSLGDVIAQLIDSNSIDSRRLMSVGTFAFFAIGPIGWAWYPYLQTLVSGRYAVLQWVAIDQLLFAPCFIAFFIVGTTALEGNGLQKIRDQLALNYIPSVLANYSIWPPAQVINYMVVPPTWRMLFVNVVGFFWNIILTFLSHRERETFLSFSQSSSSR